MHATQAPEQWAKVRVSGFDGIETDHIDQGRRGARPPHILRYRGIKEAEARARPGGGRPSVGRADADERPTLYKSLMRAGDETD